MLFSFHCPSCKSRIEADASTSGGQVDCPQCGRPVGIPEARVGPGSTLAGFRLERRLGKGSMGEVYLALQLSVERQVAVKILPPGFAENPDAVRRFLKEGKLIALGVSTKRRADVAPDVPSIAEQGLKDFNISLWFGMWAPAATPPAIVQKLNAQITLILQNPEVREQFAKLGIGPVPMKPDEFAKFVRDEIVNYQRIVTVANIQPL